MARNNIYMQGPCTYVDIHDNEVVNLSVDKGMVHLEDQPVQDLAPQKQNKGGRPKRTGQKITQSFIYNGGQDTNARLQLLYNGLISLNWIREDTDLRHFMSQFSGEEATCRVVWTGEINSLAELFKELVTRKKLVKLPQGVSLWVMVNARFWEKEGNREFGSERLRSTRTPIDTKAQIELLVKLMDSSIPIPEMKKMIQSQR